MSDFLLEIGCEDLPPSYVLPAFAQLKRDAENLFSKLRLEHGEIYTTGAPRRLLLYVKNLSSMQKEKTQRILGPLASKGSDENGLPTPAAKGFARSLKVEVSHLKIFKTERGEYLGIEKKPECRSTKELLKEHMPELISGLKFPKSMRWESGGNRYARPVRWIVSLYGREVMEFEFAGVRSGNVSYKIPWLKKHKIRIPTANTYFRIMKGNSILVDHERREEKIKSMAKRSASALRCNLVEDEELIHEVAFMLEDPRAFTGTFNNRYLSLPPEIVITAMKAHQRYFAMKKRGKLVPKFLSFYDGRKNSIIKIRRGNEKVLKARLEDALFYWEEDIKRGMVELSKRLNGIIFLEGFGSMMDKSKRMRRLMEFMSSRDKASAIPLSVIERIALLAKADLASEMVKDGKEFTLLEGLIGSHYARLSGESDEVVVAIKEQYLPRSFSDPIPSSRPGLLLSIADKMDTISGCFLAGLIPTGSQDPYALRRQALGIIRILEDEPVVPLYELMQMSLSLYDKERMRCNEAAQKIEQFFKDRMEYYLRERGIEYDVLDAVTIVNWALPARCYRIAKSIQGIRGKEAFELLITGVKRVGNIIAGDVKIYGEPITSLRKVFEGNGRLGGDISFTSTVLEDNAEKDLLRRILEVLPELELLDENDEFPQIMSKLASLGPAIDTFFDRVLVNCENEALRHNRHGFLACIFALFSRYADFSIIVD